ncbi:pkd-2 [Symbiodinium pilosum]|uniref:Pkd-2 protein n=1 Tax=Symbiodinium pilosum TaxID=2952 RepID=A0A812WTH3_SYMPI|nr:pkd-2 [Symbiodinium pilosum]
MEMISCFQNPMQTSLTTMVPTITAIVIWSVLQLKLLVDEVRDAIRTVRSSKLGIWQGLLRDYFTFWNAVDWVSMCVAVMAVFFWLNLRTKVETVNGLLPAAVRGTLYPTGTTVQERRLQYQPTADAWFAAAEQMSLANSACTVTIILYPLVIMLRLFKSFQAQPRLAIVTETIKTAIPDLAHFFIVVLCIFGCLFVNSIVFFGQDLESFRALTHGWVTGTGIHGRPDSTWMLMVVSLVSLNMLLAIVLDSYAYEKEKASELKTLLQQLWEVVRRRQERRHGLRVNLQEIWDAFLVEFNYDVKAMMVNRTLITPDSLMKLARCSMEYFKKSRTLALGSGLRLSEFAFGSGKRCIRTGPAERLEIGHLTDEAPEDTVELVAEKLDYFERLQAPGDATYDFYFSEEHTSQDKASKAWISKMVSELSGDLKQTFHHGLRRYHVWQDHIEKEQTELHASITDMQNLVQQHAGMIQGMIYAVDSLLEPSHHQVASGAAGPSTAAGAPS